MTGGEQNAISVQQLLALYQICKIMREQAAYSKHRHDHAVTESLWSQFCAQLRIVEHRIEKESKQ